MATDTTPQPAKNLTTSQVPDAVAVYLAAARERWDAAANGKWHDYATALELLSSALRSAADVPRLQGAVQAALATHRVHDNGIAPAWCVPCSKEAQAAQLGSEPAVFVNAEDCGLRQAITGALTRQASTGG